MYIFPIIAVMVTAILFIIRIALLSLFDIFSENWNIRVGLVGLSVAIAVAEFT